MKKINLLIAVIILFTGCKTKTSNPPVTPPTSTVTPNKFSFQIGATSYSTSSVHGQLYLSMPDTSLLINGYNGIDTISGGFNLYTPGLGTYTHTNVVGSPTHYLLVNFGNPSGPTNTFYSKSGTISITTYNIANNTYAGTFSGIMYLSSNPSYTLPLTNGAFYYKY